MPTLKDLLAAHPALNVSWVARVIGVPRQTLHTRLRRGGPDLTAEEERKLETALSEKGLRFENDEDGSA